MWQAKPDEVLWLVPIRFTSSGSCDSIMIALSEDFALPMSVKRDQGGGTVQFAWKRKEPVSLSNRTLRDGPNLGPLRV